MKQWKRLIYYLLINVLVSACTTFAVLYFWDRTHPPVAGGVLGPLAFNVAGSESGKGASATLPASGTAQTSAEPVTPTTPPTQDPYENAIAYEVKANDTLGEIADRFDLEVEELLAFNGLTDANALSVGQVIYIPSEPEETAAPTSTAAAPLPETGMTGTPSPSAQEARVVINTVIGPGDLSTEHIFLTRSGDGELPLAGWKLEDEDGNAFVFPQIYLYKDGGVNVWTGVGSPTVIDLYWGLAQPVWESGEQVTLRDGQGEVHATYEIP